MQIQPHCPLIDGTFTLQVGGLDVALWDSGTNSYSNTNLPYNIGASSLQNALRRIQGFEQVEVVRTGSTGYGAKWIISYIGYNADVPDLVLSASGLTGGQSGTSPQVTFFETRSHSYNLLYNPVDDNFMFSASSGHSVHVTVNNLLSACVSNC